MPTNTFKIAGFKLLANKAYTDYVFSLKKEPVEPEHFLEEWEQDLSPEEKITFTREFMGLLAKKR